MLNRFLKAIGFVLAAAAVNYGMATVGALTAPKGDMVPVTTGLVMPTPKQQWFDNNGRVVSGAKLYSYAAGTTTPISTYSDSSLSTPNANPVVADSAGRMTVYMVPDTAYKFTLTTSADVPIWTQDNVSLPPTVTPPSPLAVPPGTVLTYGGSAPPTGYLLGDGTAIDRVAYASLFSIIGTTYGAGDGVTTFNLPDCRGRFPLFQAAAGTGSTLGASGGALDHTHTYSQVINHTHTVTISDPGHTHTQAAHNHTVTISDPGHTHTQAAHSHTITITDPGHDHNGYNLGGDVTVKSPGGGSDWGFGNLGTDEPNVVRPAFTGITATADNATPTINANTTGITASSGNATPTINANTTGITATTANPAGGVATGTTAASNPAYLVFQCIVKT